MPCNAEFGIVDHVEPGKAYDASYEPEKYGCVSISDDYLNDWWDRLSVLPSYFHDLNRPEKGLARFGVTLIRNPRGNLQKLRLPIPGWGPRRNCAPCWKFCGTRQGAENLSSIMAYKNACPAGNRKAGVFYRFPASSMVR